MEIIKTNKKLRFLNYAFEIYDIIYDDNTEKIDNLPEGEGLYCFTYKTNNKGYLTDNNEFHHIHELLYLGLTSDFANRPTYHNKLDELKRSSMNSISLLQLNKEDNLKEIESLILSKFKFKLNKKENDRNEELPSILVEE